MTEIEKKIEKKHKKSAFIFSILFAFALIMLFFILGFKQPDPLPIDIEDKQEIVIEASSIKFDKPKAGGGKSIPKSNIKPIKSSIKTPLQDKPSVKINTGQGQKNQPISQKNQPEIDNSLAFPGSSEAGNSNSGSGNGSGSGIGSGDDNFGSANGGGSLNKIRKRLTGPCIKQKGLVPGRVYLILYIDASGKVLRAKVDRSKTTSGNEKTFSAVEQGAIDCMTFEPRPGSGTTKIYLKNPIIVRKI